MNFDTKTGIYCLANDGVLDWMIAFLESVRTYEPNRRLIVIPFNENITKLAQLADRYQFEFFEDQSLLKALDEVGATLRPQRDIHIHRFRTLASFLGPLEEFIFLDSDIVLLDQLDDLFAAYRHENCQFMYYYGGLFDAVYVPGEFREKMIREYAANGFNAGSFLSSKGLFTLEKIQQLGYDAAQIKDAFPRQCVVQPFINYCVDISRLKTQSFSNAIPNLGPEWAKFEPIEKVGDSYQVTGKRVIYTHWAGFGHNPNMPNRELFLKFRLKSQSPLFRLRYHFQDWLKSRIAHYRQVFADTIKGSNNKLFQQIYDLYKKSKNSRTPV